MIEKVDRVCYLSDSEMKMEYVIRRWQHELEMCYKRYMSSYLYKPQENFC